MFNITPLIIILISLATIIVIVVRKFSVLANIDVETIQAEREQMVKEHIISTRFKRNFYKYYSRLMRILRPIGQLIAKGGKAFYKKLLEYRDNYKNDDACHANGPLSCAAKSLCSIKYWIISNSSLSSQIIVHLVHLSTSTRYW